MKYDIMNKEELLNRKHKILELLDLHKKITNHTFLHQNECNLYVNLLGELLGFINLVNSLKEVMNIGNSVKIEEEIYKIFNYPTVLKNRDDVKLEKEVKSILGGLTYKIQFQFLNEVKKFNTV